MKLPRMLCTLLALFVVSATLARAGDSAAPAATNPTGAPKGGDVPATIKDYERVMMEALKSRDSTAFVSHVDPGGWWTDAGGLVPMSAVPGKLQQLDIRSYALDDFQALMIDKDACLLTCTWTGDASFKGQPYPHGPWYCSTLWVKRGKDWKALFHQQTMAMPPPPAADPH